MTSLAQKGHNVKVGGIAVDQLRSIIARIEKLTEEKQAIADDIKEIYAESKGNGFENKAIKKIIAIRKLDAQTREEEETILDTYLRAMGMQMSFDLDEKENG